MTKRIDEIWKIENFEAIIFIDQGNHVVLSTGRQSLLESSISEADKLCANV